MNFVGTELKKCVVVEMAVLRQEGDETAAVCVGW